MDQLRLAVDEQVGRLTGAGRGRVARVGHRAVADVIGQVLADKQVAGVIDDLVGFPVGIRTGIDEFELAQQARKIVDIATEFEGSMVATGTTLVQIISEPTKPLSKLVTLHNIMEHTEGPPNAPWLTALFSSTLTIPKSPPSAAY